VVGWAHTQNPLSNIKSDSKKKEKKSAVDSIVRPSIVNRKVGLLGGMGDT
jgi:hypothetical protein